jgi:hypothetical protein
MRNGAPMAARNRIVLTAKQKAQVAALRKEDALHESEINKRFQRRAEIKKMLDAVEIFAAPAAEKQEKKSVAELPAESKENGDSAAFDFVENLRETGDSLNVKQARQRLSQLGHEDRANQKNYIYGLLFRLVNSGKLVKRGKRYKAAPISSSKEETGAVGAPVSH